MHAPRVLWDTQSIECGRFRFADGRHDRPGLIAAGESCDWVVLPVPPGASPRSGRGRSLPWPAVPAANIAMCRRFVTTPHRFIPPIGDSMDQVGCRSGAMVTMPRNPESPEGDVVSARIGPEIALERHHRVHVQCLEPPPRDHTPRAQDDSSHPDREGLRTCRSRRRRDHRHSAVGGERQYGPWARENGMRSTCREERGSSDEETRDRIGRGGRRRQRTGISAEPAQPRKHRAHRPTDCPTRSGEC